MINTKQKSQERGAALVELAIVLPFLLLLLMGTVELGLLFYNQQVLTNSSREGARSGIAHLTENEIIAIVENYCQNRLISFGTVPTVNTAVDGEGGPYAADLTVAVSYGYNFLVPELLGLGTSKQLRAKTIMSMERPIP